MKPHKNFLNRKMLNQYREEVKGNENITHEQATLKMWRNMLLAHESKRGKSSSHFKYGCLHFIVANDRVVWMQNGRSPQKGWKRDDEKYLELNKSLGIDSDETKLSLFVREVKGKLRYRYRKLKWKIKLLFVE